MFAAVILCLFSAVIASTTGDGNNTLKIGLLWHNAEGQVVAEVARDFINQWEEVLQNVTIEVLPYIVSREFTMLDYIIGVCHLIENSVHVIVGPYYSTATKATYPVCAGFNIPQITPSATDPSLSTSNWEYPFLMKMSTPDSEQSSAIGSIIKEYGWTYMAILTTSTTFGHNGLLKLKNMAEQNSWTIMTEELFDPMNINVTMQLQNIKNTGVHVVLLRCEVTSANWYILDEAKKLGMMTEGWVWLLASSHAEASLEPIMCDAESSINCKTAVPLEFQGLIGLVPATDPGNLFNDVEEYWKRHDVGREHDIPNIYPMRIFDAMLTAAYALDNLLKDEHSLSPPMYGSGVCASNSQFDAWSDGPMWKDYLVKAEGPGTMNYLNFTPNNVPYFTAYDVMNLQSFGWTKIGVWNKRNQKDQGKLVLTDGPIFLGPTTNIPSTDHIIFEGVTLEIVTINSIPFVMQDKSDPTKYTGMCIDLLLAIQERLKFKFHIHIVEDGNFGSYNEITKEWNGIIREIIDGKADLALADLTINEARVQVVEMTTPYLDLGLSVLLPKNKSGTRWFSFLEVFHWSLWLAVAIATVIIGFVVAICSRLNPYGYRGRYVQRTNKDDDNHRNQKSALNLGNSMMFSIASLASNGSPETPASMSGRLVGAVWWAVVIILIASYTANLTAFLTVERMEIDINSVQDLVEQSEIRYGILKSTATETFFRMSVVDPYKEMYTKMLQYDTMVDNHSSGIQKVQETGIYAHIADSLRLEFVARNPPCTTRVLTETFNKLGYGIGLKKDSPYTTELNREILELREIGFIETLARKWINGPCPDPNQRVKISPSGNQLDVIRMAGVFILLVIGIVLAFVVMLCEYLVAAHRDHQQDQKQQVPVTSMCHHIKRRIQESLLDIKCVQCGCSAVKTGETDTVSPQAEKYSANHDINSV